MRSFSTHQHSNSAALITWAARRALYMEACLWPKPGLVSVMDDGSHDDMNLGHFIRSADALDDYFCSAARSGARGEPFEALQSLGRDAEYRMFEATGGVNVHRGAIFSLGLLAASAGWLRENNLPIKGSILGETVAERWGVDIILAGDAEVLVSNGVQTARRYGARDARAEAAAGFPTLFRRALPAFTATLGATGCQRRSLIQALFATMAELDDTNLLRRGGREGLDFVRNSASTFLAAGGVFQPEWEKQVRNLHDQCIARHLSPGGSADMLAATWFVHLLQRE